jgi:tRNA nucleotidyltransferase (CCA-adding enzyme)
LAAVRVFATLDADPAVAALAGVDAVWVVGGAVRDVLLGRPWRELDFVVVGYAVAVARRAAERLDGRVTVHERFGTATVTAPAATFDLAAARRESYARPGALPDVEVGASLEEDLARRDFTVNAMAVRLADRRFAARPEAEADLAAGRLRVLHDRSFADDPTRLIRLARYATRLGFALEPHTDALAAAGVRGVDTVTGPRLGAEVRLLLDEEQPDALLALARHGLGAALLGPGFAPDADLMRATLALCPPDADRGSAALAAALAGSAPRAALDRLGFEARERDGIAAAAESAPALAAALRSADGDAALWRALRRASPEAVAVAGALAPAAGAARRWLEDVRHRRLAITGDDLVAAGLSGPPVGAALDAATEAMLDGRAATPEAQVAAGLAAAAGS